VLLGDANILQIFLSALAGALCASAIGHYVRILEQKQARRKVEQRNAYVYLSKIVAIIAIGDVLATCGKVLGPYSETEQHDNQKTTGTNLEAALSVSTVIHVAANDTDILINPRQRDDIRKMVERLSDHEKEFLGFELDHNTLTTLPAAIIPEYVDFCFVAWRAKAALTNLCAQLCEIKSRTTPEEINDVWVVARDLYSGAVGLARMLRAHGEIDTKTFDSMLVRYRGRVASWLLLASNEKKFANHEPLEQFVGNALRPS